MTIITGSILLVLEVPDLFRRSNVLANRYGTNGRITLLGFGMVCDLFQMICYHRLIKWTADETIVEKKSSKYKKFDSGVPWTLETDEDGWPLIPDGDDFDLQQMKDIIRSFITLSYREDKFNFHFPCLYYSQGKTVGDRHVKVPWRLLEKKPASFISSKYLPEGVKICDPSNMHSADLRSMLLFLSKRQLGSLKVFRFKKSLQKTKPSHTSLKKRKRIEEDNTDEFVQGSSKGRVVDDVVFGRWELE